MFEKVYFFYGNNIYSLRNKINTWKTQFSTKFGADSIFHFTNQNWDQAMIRQALFGSGLFVTQKLVILEGAPKDSAPENSLSESQIEWFFTEFLQNVTFLNADTLVIFVSYKPDRRTKYFKRLLKELPSKNAQEFLSFKIPELKSFIREQLHPLQIGDQLLDYFIALIGEDLYRVSAEIEKLKSLNLPNPQLTQEIIDTYCFSNVEADAFSFFDQLLTQPQTAVATLEKIQQNNAHRLQVQGLLLRGLRTDIQVLEAYLSGKKDSKAIIAETKLAPFTVIKTLKQIDLLIKHQDFLRSFLLLLVELDYEIKSWKMLDEVFWLKVKTKVLELKR